MMKLSRRMIISAFSVVMILSLLISVASASVLTHLDFESATVEDDWDLVDSGVTISEKKMDHNNVNKPWLSAYTPSGTGNSLKFQHNPDSGGTIQRTEYYLAPNESFSNWRYVGFDFTTATLPSATSWALVMQFQQKGYFVSPIGALELKNINGNINILFRIKNEDYYQIDNLIGPSGHSITIWNSNISGWNDFVIGFKPDPAGGGQVKIWKNGVLVADWTGKLGYTPGFLSKPFTSYYQNTFGLYRGSQNTTMSVYFDNVKFGTTYADVAP